MNDPLNPYRARLQEAQACFDRNASEYAQAVRDLSWFAEFDVESSSARLHRIQRENAKWRDAVWASIHAIEQLHAEIQRLVREMPSSWDILNHSLRKVMRAAQIAAERDKSQKLSELSALLTHQAPPDEEQALEADLARYREFDPLAAQARQQKIPAAQAVLQQLIDDLSAQCQRLNDVLEPYRVQLEEYQRQEYRLVEELSRLEMLARQMDCEDRYGRAMLHQECEQEFGIASPARGVSQWNNKLKTVRYRISKQRAVMATVSERTQNEVRAVVIDGSNLMYADGLKGAEHFVGLRALEVLVPALAQRYDKVFLYVDYGEARKLKMSQKALKQRFAPWTPRVHLTRSGESADESILAAAEADPHTYVVSGDQYREHGIRFPFIAKRRLDAKVTLDHVMVHDLDIRLQLADVESA